MSLSAWEQQALNSIKDGLAGSDPELATLLAAFTELASGEEMPARENIRVIPHWVIRRLRRKRRHRSREPAARIGRFLRARYVLVLLLLVTAALISVAVALSRSGSHVPYQEFWPTSCAHPAPASSPATPGQGT
jgi:Protein of unknown function (DUF3040)